MTIRFHYLTIFINISYFIYLFLFRFIKLQFHKNLNELTKYVSTRKSYSQRTNQVSHKQLQQVRVLVFVDNRNKKRHFLASCEVVRSEMSNFKEQAVTFQN